jgi:hypothetical protein
MRTIHPIRLQRTQLRKAEVQRQKAVVDAVWQQGATCAVCQAPVERPGAARSARTVGHVRFTDDVIDVEHGRLLCGRHFYAKILKGR